MQYIYIASKEFRVVSVFANAPGDLGSIPDGVIPKIKKILLDASLLNSQHYKLWIKGSGAIQKKQ